MLGKIHHPAEEKKEFAEMNLTDHAGVRLTHGKPQVNGVEIHYAIGGAGEPVFLLHGVPKTMSYWRHVVPLLTPHYTVITVDNRGSGGSQRPLTGYDTATMAADVAPPPCTCSDHPPATRAQSRSKRTFASRRTGQPPAPRSSSSSLTRGPTVYRM